jgi:NADH-quinone oxidoreductase subunit C
MRFSRKRQQQVQLPPYTDEVLARITEAFPDQVSPVASVDWPTVIVGREALLNVCRFLRDELGFSFLTDLTGVDWLGRTGNGEIPRFARNDSRGGSSDSVIPSDAPKEREARNLAVRPRFEVVYHLFSLTHNRRMRLKVRVLESDPHVPSVVELWPTANFHEREVFDFYGVIFDGHPNLTKMLTPDFMEGHPLRKDFPLGGEEIWAEEGGSIVQQPGSYRAPDQEGVRHFR